MDNMIKYVLPMGAFVLAIGVLRWFTAEAATNPPYGNLFIGLLCLGLYCWNKLVKRSA
jgi:hypothetical protein